MAGIFQHLPGTSNYSSFLGRDPRDARNLEISSTMEPVESEIKKNSTDRARSGGRRKIRRASESESERERARARERESRTGDNEHRGAKTSSAIVVLVQGPLNANLVFHDFLALVFL